MERKNTVLLTVIAVATLLVAVVGATFAYFTAASEGTKQIENEASATTANVGKQTLNISSIVTGGDMKYPGGILVSGVKVEGTVEGANNYNMAFGLKGSVDASTWVDDSGKTTLNWTLYASDTEVKNNPVTGCTLDEGHLTSNQYTYGTSCKLAQGIEGTAIKSGTVTLGSAATEITVANSESSTNLTFSGVNSGQSQKKYYYLVVQFDDAEMENSQNDNRNKSITVSLTDITDSSITYASAS